MLLSRFSRRLTTPPHFNFGVFPEADSSTDVQAAIDSFAATAAEQKANIEKMNARLWALASENTHVWTGSGRLEEVSAWHGLALDWMNRAGTVVNQLQQMGSTGILSPEGYAAFVATDLGAAWEQANGGGQFTMIEDWIASGGEIAKRGRQVANDITEDASFLAFVASVADALPVVLGAALDAVKRAALALVQAGGEVVKEILKQGGEAANEAAWGLTTTLLVLGLGLGGFFWLLKKSGVKGGIGPVSIGG